MVVRGSIQVGKDKYIEYYKHHNSKKQPMKTYLYDTHAGLFIKENMAQDTVEFIRRNLKRETEYDKLLYDFLPYIAKVARSYIRKTCPYEDLISEGIIAFHKCYEGYKKERGPHFKAYFRVALKNTLRRYSYKNMSQFSTPCNIRRDSANWDWVANNTCESLDYFCVGQTDRICEKTYNTEAEDNARLHFEKTALRRILNLLPPLQRRMVEIRYGLDEEDGKETTREHIREMYGDEGVRALRAGMASLKRLIFKSKFNEAKVLRESRL